eukprot:8302644-Pyramimonas_sp.AAC.1
MELSSARQAAFTSRPRATTLQEGACHERRAAKRPIITRRYLAWSSILNIGGDDGDNNGGDDATNGDCGIDGYGDCDRDGHVDDEHGDGGGGGHAGANN